MEFMICESYLNLITSRNVHYHNEMEPHLIDYYNETPQMVKIIDNMNKEYDDLYSEYIKLKNKELK